MSDNSVLAAALPADPSTETLDATPTRWDRVQANISILTHRAVDAGRTSRGRAGYLGGFITFVCVLLMISPGAAATTAASEHAPARAALVSSDAAPAPIESQATPSAGRSFTPLAREVRVSRVRADRMARLHLARVRSEVARAAHVRAAKSARAAHIRAVKAAHARAHRLARLRYRLMRVRVLPIWRSYRIGEGFGVSGWHWGSGRHTGIDLDVPIGTHVHAAMAGTIISAHWEGSYGNCIRIRHYNGVVTRYAHLSKIKVKVGQYVQAGQVIANSGNTGNTTGPHLHFEVIIHGTPVNPRHWLR